MNSVVLNLYIVHYLYSVGLLSTGAAGELLRAPLRVAWHVGAAWWHGVVWCAGVEGRGRLPAHAPNAPSAAMLGVCRTCAHLLQGRHMWL